MFAMHIQVVSHLVLYAVRMMNVKTEDKYPLSSVIGYLGLALALLTADKEHFIVASVDIIGHTQV